MISRHIPAEDERVNLHHKHSFVNALVPTFCARGFIEGCYKSLLKSWGMGLDPLIPRGKVRCRKACRARPDRVRFAPFVRVRTTWNCRVADFLWKKIESLHGNYAAKCKTGFVACWWSKFDWSVFGMWVAPKSRVAWVNRVSWMKVPFQLPDLQFYILTEFCLIPLWDWTFATWWSFNSRFWRDGQVLADKWCTSDAFLLEFALASFHGISARDLQAQKERPFQFLKSSQAMAGGGRRMKKTRQTTDIKWPLWQHLWHLLKRLWLLQDGLVSSHVPSSQKLRLLKQHRSSVDMEFFQCKWEHGVHTVHTPFVEYGVYFVRVGRSTWIRRWAESHTGWNGESGKHASKSGNSLKLNCHEQTWTKCDA